MSVDGLPFGPYGDHEVTLAPGVTAIVRVQPRRRPLVIELTIEKSGGVTSEEIRDMPIHRWMVRALGFEPLRPQRWRRNSGEIPKEFVAATWMHALERGGNPAQAVADSFGLAASTATYWIKVSRDAGLLEVSE